MKQVRYIAKQQLKQMIESSREVRYRLVGARNLEGGHHPTAEATSPSSKSIKAC